MNQSSENKGFKIPEGYFAQFPDRLSPRIQDEGHKTPVKGAFKVPEKYFESFPDRLEAHLSQNETKVRKLLTSPLIWIPAAAAVALMLLFLPLLETSGPKFEDLAGESIESYLETGDFYLRSQELADALPLEQIGIGDMLETTPREEQIIDYLENYTNEDDELYLDGND